MTQPETPTNDDRLYHLFQLAVAQPPGDRARFLTEACGADTSLWADLNALLAQDERAEAEGFLDGLLQSPTSPRLGLCPGESSRVGQRFGPYEICNWIASGGMGSVYRAVRVEDYTREVALKIVRSPLLGDELHQRFHTERQVLADLDHPAIARLLDGGTTEDGLPYLVMELIDGQPIDRHCEVRQLPTRERVQLLVAVCEAVSFAHRQGVIHRDLKPANILVTTDGRPKLTDFGLAKYLDRDHGQTHSGQILGTPSYMAPEQARGQSDAAGAGADVYALGAILYELLTGRPPFKGSTWPETLEQVLSLNPISPRRLVPRLPRDLETICLKCLEKAPSQRYPTAKALAEDLQRYLQGEPIHARPVGLVGSLWRRARRVPAAVYLTGMVILLGLIVAGVTGLYRLEQARARQEKEEADEQRHQAQQNLHLSFQGIDSFAKLSQNPALRASGFESIRSLLVETVLKNFQEVVRLHGDEPEVRYRMALTYLRLASFYQGTEESTEPLRLAREGLAVLEKLAEEHPEYDLYEFQIAQAAQFVANRLKDSPEEQLRLLEWSLAIRRRYAKAHPEDSGVQSNLAFSLLGIGQRLGNQGRLEEALQYFQPARAIWDQLTREHPKNQGYRDALAQCQEALGLAYAEIGKSKEAVDAYQCCCDLRKELARQAPTEAAPVLHLARAYRRLAAAQGVAGNRQAALQSLNALRDLEGTQLDWEVRQRPAVVVRQGELAKTSLEIAILHLAENRPKDALDSLGRAAELADRILQVKREDANLLNLRGKIWYQQGLAHLREGRLAEAEHGLGQARDIWQRLVREKRATTEVWHHLGNAWAGLGDVRIEQGRDADAHDCFENAVREQQEAVRREKENVPYRQALEVQTRKVVRLKGSRNNR